MNEILLFGFGVPGLVIVVMQIAKMLGLPDKAAPIGALVATIVLTYLAQVAAKFPEIEPYLQPLVIAIMTWATATGGYELIKKAAMKLGLTDKKETVIVAKVGKGSGNTNGL